MAHILKRPNDLFRVFLLVEFEHDTDKDTGSGCKIQKTVHANVFVKPVRKRGKAFGNEGNSKVVFS
jgi:hypothetical protein